MRDMRDTSGQSSGNRYEDTVTAEQVARVLCHDIGSPARALRQYLAMLKQAQSENQKEQIDWTVERMTSALDRLDRVLDDYGSASQRATPGHTTDPTPFLIDIANDIGVAVTISNPLFKWPLDERDTATVIEEVVKNVRDHAAGPLHVSTFDRTVIFRDSGRGIDCDPEDLFLLFRPVHPAQSNHRGLGLARVKALLQSIRASIVLECFGPHGTQVLLQFASND